MFIRNKKNGFNLIELLLVLAITAAIIISAFIIYPKIKNNMNTNILLNEISLIRATINEIYSGSANFSGLNNRLLINSGSLPKSMIKDSSKGTLVSQTGSPITLSSPFDNAYYIQIFNLSNIACIQLVSHLFQSMNGYNVVQINSTGYGRDLTLSEITSACSKNDYGVTQADNNLVSIEMRN